MISKQFGKYLFGSNKKAQITLFIIIGVVLLVGASLFFFLNQKSEVTKEDFTSGVTTAKPYFRPVQDYVESCMGIVTREALDLVGEHGGYVDPFDISYAPLMFYSDSEFGNNDGVLFGEKKASMIPYWIQSTSSVKTDFINVKLRVPSFAEIEDQISLYVDSHLKICLDNLSAMSNQGFEILEFDEPKSKTHITDNDVVVKTNMKLQLKKENQIQDFEAFLVRAPVPLSDYLIEASLILYEEYQSQYLENLLTRLVGYYGNLDSDSLPPFSMHSISNAPVIWTQYQIKQQLKSLLNTYVPLFRFQDTNNKQLIDDVDLTDQEKAFYNSFLLSSPFAPTENLKINHLFLDNEIYSKVTSPTHSGEILSIEPETRSGFIMKAPESDSFYNFYYDLTYPVVVEITQNNLSDGSSYTFLFAMEANVRNNLNQRDFLQNRDPIDWNPNSIRYTAVKPESEEGQSQEKEEVDEFYPTKKLFSNSKLFTSGNVSLQAYDLNTGQPLGDVLVSVGIADYSQKAVGRTKFNVYGNAAFSSKLPIFKNGFLILEKEGYQEKYVPLSTYENQEMDLGSIGLNKIHSKQIFVQILEEKRIPQQITSDLTTLTNGMISYTLRNMSPSEQVFLTLTRLPTDDDFSTFSRVALINSSTSIQNIDLVPGKYELKGILIDNDGVVVPANSKKTCKGTACWFMSEEDKYMPNEPIEIKPAMWGGVEFTNAQPWFLSANELYDNTKEIDFTMFKFAPPKNIDSLQNIADIETKTKLFRADLLPKSEPLIIVN